MKELLISPFIIETQVKEWVLENIGSNFVFREHQLEAIVNIVSNIVNEKEIRSNEKIEKHAEWAEQFLPKYDHITEENVMDILKKEVGITFTHVLEDAGVYKCTPEGREAFLRFVAEL